MKVKLDYRIIFGVLQIFKLVLYNRIFKVGDGSKINKNYLLVVLAQIAAVFCADGVGSTGYGREGWVRYLMLKIGMGRFMLALAGCGWRAGRVAQQCRLPYPVAIPVTVPVDLCRRFLMLQVLYILCLSIQPLHLLRLHIPLYHFIYLSLLIYVIFYCVCLILVL